MIIGLTGGLGCGKSTAAKIFAELGFKILDSDQLVEEIYTSDAFVQSAIMEHFGNEILNEQGTIDRKLLSQKVFRDKQELNWLEDLVHPRVKLLRENYISKDPKSNWVIEIPLLFEKKLENEFDITICLSAQLDVQLSRLAQKGMSSADVEARLACQMPLEQKEKQADYVIYNNGNINSLRTQIYSLTEALKLFKSKFNPLF